MRPKARRPKRKRVNPPKKTYRKRVKRKQKRVKRGPKSFQEKSELFRFAGQRTQIQDEKNNLRSPETLKNIRYGFTLMWRSSPRFMRRYKIGEKGSFDPLNCHGGVCWGWPKECNLTNTQARAILYDCYKSRLLT